jgi:hypothetical protein
MESGYWLIQIDKKIMKGEQLLQAFLTGILLLFIRVSLYLSIILNGLPPQAHKCRKKYQLFMLVYRCIIQTITLKRGNCGK